MCAGPNRLTRVLVARRLHRELEWIPMKAMRKDRTRRYRSASELSDDIQNYLTGAPLIAGPESSVYRARKFIRKHAGYTQAQYRRLVRHHTNNCQVAPEPAFDTAAVYSGRDRDDQRFCSLRCLCQAFADRWQYLRFDRQHNTGRFPHHRIVVIGYQGPGEFARQQFPV